MVWSWPAEDHLTGTFVNEKYAIWRQKGIYTHLPIRYPNSREGAKDCLCAFNEISPILPEDDPSTVLRKLGPPLNYIESRKQIYLSEYLRLVRKVPKYQELKELKELKERLNRGENLLIIEVDGPHQESLPYYQKTYGVKEDFIQNHSMLATKENLEIMLNDPKHPFGHGYCLAVALQNL